MDIEFLTLQPREPASIDMRLGIEPEMNNRGEEEKGKMGKYRRGKQKGAKNFMRHTTTLGLKYGKVGQSNGVIVGRVRLASSRSLGSNCRSPKFWVQDVYPNTGHESSIAPTREPAVIKLAKYGNERRSVRRVM
jgi:hypothetical protein